MWGAMAYRSTPIVVTSGTPGRTPTRAAGRPRFVKSRPGARCTAGCRRAFYSTTRCIVVSVRLSSAASAFTTVYRLSPSTRREAGTRIGAGFAGPMYTREPRVPGVTGGGARVAGYSARDPRTAPGPGRADARTTLGVRRRLDPVDPHDGAARARPARPARVSGVIEPAKCVRG